MAINYTIVVDDKLVVVNGVAKVPVEFTLYDPEIRAVQWMGEYGYIEFKTQVIDGQRYKSENEYFYDATKFQDAITAWENWVDPDPRKEQL